jgi:ornithine cyclodeaminase/alanine dehydrogenase
MAREPELLYLSRADVEAVGLTMREIIDVVEKAFGEKGKGNVEMPPKPGVHSRPDAFIHAMPAYIPSLDAIGMKWVSGYPTNPERGLPYITGLVVLNDPETGFPKSVMDCVWITAMRTAAASAVAAKYLARPESETLGILGAGVQGFTHLEAFRELFPLKKVVVYDINPDQMERYSKKVLALWEDIEVVQVGEPREAVEGLDLVVTAGPILKVPHATNREGWLAAGAFASLVDFDSYWRPSAMKEASKFVTDDIPQLNHYRDIGYFQDIPDVYAEVGDLVIGKKPGREGDAEKTMTCNLGLAMNDIAVAPLVYSRAVEKGLGVRLPL